MKFKDGRDVKSRQSTIGTTSVDAPLYGNTLDLDHILRKRVG